MRNAYAVVGLGFVILFLGIYVLNSRFTKSGDTGIIASSTSAMPSTLTLTSPAFDPGSHIPAKFTCDGEQVSPPLAIASAPEGTVSFALIVEDPDVPVALLPSGLFVHWVVFNIPATTAEIPQGAHVGVEGVNGSGAKGYTGPCPPAQYEPRSHRYFFRLYALATELDLQAGATRDQVLQAMKGHVVGEAQLMGTYGRP